jgi:hypothetical protein
MIPFTHSNQRSQDMVARRPSVVKRLFADPVGQRVHAERSLLDEARAYNARIHQSAPPIAPSQASNKHRKHPSREEETFAVILMLPNNNSVAIKIAHVRPPLNLRIAIQHHPPDMREQQAAHHTVGILHRVRPPMVCAVIRAPPAYAALDGAGPCEREE